MRGRYIDIIILFTRNGQFAFMGRNTVNTTGCQLFAILLPSPSPPRTFTVRTRRLRVVRRLQILSCNCENFNNNTILCVIVCAHRPII